MIDLGKIRIPVLHISGWWDGDGIGTKLHWASLREAKHQSQWLIYGPWEHDFNGSNNPANVTASEQTDSAIVRIPAGRKDLLIYKTEPLSEALDIAGPTPETRSHNDEFKPVFTS